MQIKDHWITTIQFYWVIFQEFMKKEVISSQLDKLYSKLTIEHA
jgi:hypothetical protein